MRSDKVEVQSSLERLVPLIDGLLSFINPDKELKERNNSPTFMLSMNQIKFGFTFTN